jgi:hypothetical protein
MRPGAASFGALFGLALACCSATATAAGEPQQRLGAELLILSGDLRRLASGEGGALERQGLELRLAGALSSLPLLLRRAGGDAAAVRELRADFAARDWHRLKLALDALGQQHRFDARPLLAAVPTATTLTTGGEIHRLTCAGCHDAPPVDALLPSKNLTAQLRSMPRAEFAARLWLGVRGDAATALANPFSSAELAALIAWYGQ